MTAAPRRIQRRRTKGWRAPEGAIYVGRPSRWGNPYRWTDHNSRYWAVNDFKNMLRDPQRAATAAFETMLNDVDVILAYPSVEQIRADLAGRDLMCWCPLSAPCHADVLLNIANDRPTP